MIANQQQHIVANQHCVHQWWWTFLEADLRPE